MYKQGQLFCLTSIWSVQVCGTLFQSPLFIVKYGRPKEAYLTIFSLTWVKWRWESISLCVSITNFVVKFDLLFSAIDEYLLTLKFYMQPKRLSSLLNEDPAVMERRTALAKRLELYRAAQAEIDAVAWSK